MGPFATATELSDRTGIPLPENLSRWQALLQDASALIRQFCEQTLSLVTGDIVTLYPRASTLLTLPERPVVAVATVTVNGVATTNYYVTPRGIRSGTVASPGTAWLSGATVTYSHGYAETSPQFGVLRTVCIDAAARALTHDATGETQAFGPTLVESVGYTPQVFLTPGEMEMLKRFRRGPVR